MTRIIAIDPGTTHSAFTVMHGETIIAHQKATNRDVLQFIKEHALDYGRDSFDALCVEMVASYGMPVGKEVFETVLWIGRFIEAAESRGLHHVKIYRQEVKLHLCKSAKANDASIRQAIIDRYGPGKDAAIGKKAAPGPLYGISGDEWSAVAVGLTAQGI